MLNKCKAILSLLAFFIMLSSLAFAQGEDFFVGTWQGRLSGEGLSASVTFSGRWKTGFEMDIILKVAERRRQSPEEGGALVRPVSGWATVHYKTPEWIKIDPDYHGEAKIESRSGQIDGAIRTSVWGWPGGEEEWTLDLSYDQVLPEGTWTIYHLCSEPECDLPENPCPPFSGSIKGCLLGVEMYQATGGRLKVTPNKDSIALHEELKGGLTSLMPPHARKMMEIMPKPVMEGMQLFFGEGGMLAKEHKLTGMLYKVQGQEHILGDTIELNELIITDEHMRKEIIIPNVGEVIVDVNSECKFKTDRLLEQMKGELFYKLRKLEPHQFEIRTPVSVIGPRGTQFVTSVKKDGTTTLTVLEGSVEFSDLDKKKTVVVKKNQRSMVEPGGLPAEPVSIDEKRIPIWWK